MSAPEKMIRPLTRKAYKRRLLETMEPAEVLELRPRRGYPDELPSDLEPAPLT